MKLYRKKQNIIRAANGFSSFISVQSPHLNLFEGLKKLTEEQPNVCSHDEEEPIFLLATAWRTGSTLLQRILVTDPNVIMWGEPHGDLDIINRLGEIVAGFCRVIAPDSVIITTRTKKMSGEWIANLYPRTSVIRQAMQSMVYNWLALPAKELGYTRWGMKEVRLGYAEAALLLWLFPKAKFVVITRDPRESYRSSMQLGALWERWPDRLVNNAYTYGQLWNRLALGWQSAAPDFPHRLYRLEDLTNEDMDFNDLASFCQLNITPQDAIGKKVGSGRSDVNLSFVDKVLLDHSTQHARNWLRYA